MAEKLNLVTGATGLLGSHIAEQLRERGERVRALVRPTSDTTALEEMGVELAVGDLGDSASVQEALAGVDVVYHCAAKVGDWSPWQQFQTEVIDATRYLLNACQANSVKRVLYVSSIMVYGHLQEREEPFKENEPLGQNLWWYEYYAHSKIRAEKLFAKYPGEYAIIRPSWIFGPRDRNTLPRLIKAVKSRRTAVIGTGNKFVNLVYVGDVARAAILAANSELANGRAYNISSHGELTHQELLNILTEFLGVPPITKSVSPKMAVFLGWFAECVGRLIFLKRPPHVTRYGVGLFLRSTNYSTEKAEQELGWEPQKSTREALRWSLESQFEKNGQLSGIQPSRS
ncbi:MAG: NAD-dependent epimerase/dehydratase family protein [Gemmataceae bacterium]